MVGRSPSKTKRILEVGLVGLLAVTGLYAFTVFRAASSQWQAASALDSEGTAAMHAAEVVSTDLAQMDLALTLHLLSIEPDGDGGARADAFAMSQRELSTDLVRAAQESEVTGADVTAIERLTFQLPTYGRLAEEAIDARTAGDEEASVDAALAAHQLIAGPFGLQDQARQWEQAAAVQVVTSARSAQDDSADAEALMEIAAWVLGAALLGAQCWTGWRFRRLVNPGLLVATVVLLAVSANISSSLQSSDDQLQRGADDALLASHWMARADTAVHEARQGQALRELAGADSDRVVDASVEFRVATSRLVRADGTRFGTTRGVATEIGGGGATLGYLIAASGDSSAGAAITTTLFEAYTEFVIADEILHGEGRGSIDDERSQVAFDDLSGAIADGARTEQLELDARADDASGSVAAVGAIAAIGLTVIAASLTFGLWVRLREYAG